MKRRCFWPVVAIALSSVAVVVAQDQLVNCNLADHLAEKLWSEYTAGCLIDLSTCSAGWTCPADCLVNNVDQSITTCTDGCTYTWGDYTVTRSFTGGYGLEFNAALGIDVPVYTYGFDHAFTAGATGGFYYVYGGDYSDESRPTLEEGGICIFSFNGVDCPCTQKYCNEAQTIFAHYIDCSAVEGGAVIDNCLPLPAPPSTTTTASLSLLEILYHVPALACAAGTNENGNTNSGEGDNPGTTTPNGPETEVPATGPTSSSTTGDEEESLGSEAGTSTINATSGSNENSNDANGEVETGSSVTTTTLPPTPTTISGSDQNDSATRGTVSTAAAAPLPTWVSWSSTTGYALLVLLVALSP